MKYAMIKIRDPKNVPISMICQYQNDDVPMAPQQQFNQAQAQAQPNVEKINPILKSKCTQNPALSQIQHEALEVFKLEWKFKNNGEGSWPQDVRFIQVNGDKLVQEIEISSAGHLPNDEIIVVQQITCPSKTGLYSGFFRLAHGPDSIEFGEKVYIDLLVKEVEADKKK